MYCTTMFWCGLKPNDVSISCSAAGDSLLWVRSRSACSGLPGMNRGMKKFRSVPPRG